MAIQRGIALSAFSETTAGLTLGQGFQAGAQQQQQRACVHALAQPGKSDASLRRRGCALWAGWPALARVAMLSWTAKCLMLRGPTQMSNGDGDGDLHATTPAWEVGSDGPDASIVGGRSPRCVCQALFLGVVG